MSASIEVTMYALYLKMNLSLIHEHLRCVYRFLQFQNNSEERNRTLSAFKKGKLSLSEF